MTTAPITPGNPYYDALVERVGEGDAIAILNLINDRIEVRTPEIISEMFGANREVLIGLAQRVQELSARHGDQPEVRQAAAEVAQATRAHNDTDSGSEPAVEADAARAERVAEAVDRTERQLDGQSVASDNQPEQPVVPESQRRPAPSGDDYESRLRAVEEQGTRHAAILSRNYDGERPPSRFEPLEGSVSHAVEVSASAIAIARASVGSDRSLRRGAVWGAIAFVAVFVVYLLIFGLTDLDWTLRDQFAWPFGALAIGFIAGVLTAMNDRAEAHADDGTDIFEQDDNRHDSGGRQAQARAEAHV